MIFLAFWVVYLNIQSGSHGFFFKYLFIIDFFILFFYKIILILNII